MWTLCFALKISIHLHHFVAHFDGKRERFETGKLDLQRIICWCWICWTVPSGAWACLQAAALCLLLLFWEKCFQGKRQRILRGRYMRNMERKGSKTETKATHFNRQIHIVWCHRCGDDNSCHTLDPVFLRNRREQPELHHTDAIHT